MQTHLIALAAVLLSAPALVESSMATATTSTESTAAKPRLRVPVGSVVPPLEFTDLRNAPEDADLSAEGLKDKVVILEFWGPFCGPCIAEFPHINELVEEFKDEPVVFLSVADSRFENCEAILDSRELDTWQVFDHEFHIFNTFGVEGMPRTIIIGRDGKLAAYTDPRKIDSDMIKAAIAGKHIRSFYGKAKLKPAEDDD